MYNSFKGCTQLTTVGNIPSNCKDYGSCFNGCSSLSSVPETGWIGGGSLFSGCSKLNQKIVIERANDLNGIFRNNSSLTITPILPKNVNCGMNNCFNGCSKLVTPPTTPKGVTNMKGAYYGCTSMTKAPNIPETCKDVSSCFSSCTSLVEGAVLHENISKIDFVYEECTSLKKVYKPVKATLTTKYTPLKNCTSLEEIIWIGERNKDYLVTDLINTDVKLLPQQSINGLIPEHLDDLYKDSIKINTKTDKININGKEAVDIYSARYVEYIQATSTDTLSIGQFTVNTSTRVEIKCSSTLGVGIFNLGSYDRDYLSLTRIYQGSYRAVFCSTVAQKWYNTELDDIKSIIINSSGLSVDGNVQEYEKTPKKDFSITANVTLFDKSHLNDTGGSARIYYFKYYDGDTLKFDGRPCLINEKYPALYDEVSKKFFLPKS